jgi:hypothetical protein
MHSRSDGANEDEPVAIDLKGTRSLRVGTLLYAVTVDEMGVLYAEGDKRHSHSIETMDVLGRLNGLREELGDPMRIATGRVPRLAAFSADWGRGLMPDVLLDDPPDVLVVVPHGPLHDLPLHLVETQDGSLLGARCGVSYSSSRTMFLRCAERNRARGAEAPPAPWVHEESAETEAEEKRMRDTTFVFEGGGTDVVRGDERFSAIAARLGSFFTGQVRVDGPPLPRWVAKPVTAHHRKPAAICLVAHGFIDDSNHKLSGLLLDRETGMVASRPIEIHGYTVGFMDRALREPPLFISTESPCEVLAAAELEIDASVTAPLVLLLGCSAGGGRVLQADEPASLAETFLHIGASTVIAPIWDSDVQAMLEWAEVFGQAWVTEGQPTALAAREAFRALQANGYGLERTGTLTVRGDWL